MKNQKVILLICDGLGYRLEKQYNAVAAAKTPNLDGFFNNYPNALLAASGEAIGLPEGQMGTSEANHLVIGSGRVVYQNLAKINKAAKEGTLTSNEALLEIFDHVKKHDSSLHIKGILGEGGVHGHSDHIKALIKAAKEFGIKKIYLHLFTDGRDTPPKSALKYLDDLEEFIETEGAGKIVSIGGRYWGMDRDNNIDRIEKHFDVMVKGKGEKFKSAKDAVQHHYDKNITDEFIEPVLIESAESQVISENDGVIFANFRSDRAGQLTRRFLAENIENLKYASMTKYADDLDISVLFPPEVISDTLSEVIAKNNLKQLKVTETEKFTHLTFFFNAQRYEEEKGEERILIESNKDVATHDEKPEMKLEEITKQILRAINNDTFDFVAANLTNCDMVGHSGNFDATVKAVEAIDHSLGIIVNDALKKGYAVIITADHGNAEETFDSISGQPMTSHTLNPVPFILISDEYKEINRNEGDLSDIAPTILKIMGLDSPASMTGKSFV